MLKSLLALFQSGSRIAALTALVSWMVAAHALDGPAPAGRIVAINGGDPVLKIVNNASHAARDAKAGDELFMSDMLVTRPSQVATLELLDKTELVLAPDSRLTIEDFVREADSQHTVLGLLYGRLRALVRRHYGPAEIFAVKTPSAVEGVRGTHFVTEVDRSTGETSLHTLHGSVAMGASLEALKNPASTTLVSTGFTAEMKKGATTSTTPRAFNSGEFHQHLQQISPAFDRGVGKDAQGAGTGNGNGSGASADGNKRTSSLSDALSRQHQQAGQSQGPGSDSRGLRSGGPGLQPGPGGGPGMGGGGGQGGTQAGGQTVGQPGGQTGGQPGGQMSGQPGSGAPGGIAPAPTQSSQIPPPTMGAGGHPGTSGGSIGTGPGTGGTPPNGGAPRPPTH